MAVSNKHVEAGAAELDTALSAAQAELERLFLLASNHHDRCHLWTQQFRDAKTHVSAAWRAVGHARSALQDN